MNSAYPARKLSVALLVAIVQVGCDRYSDTTIVCERFCGQTRETFSPEQIELESACETIMACGMLEFEYGEIESSIDCRLVSRLIDGDGSRANRPDSAESQIFACAACVEADGCFSRRSLESDPDQCKGCTAEGLNAFATYAEAHGLVEAACQAVAVCPQPLDQPLSSPAACAEFLLPDVANLPPTTVDRDFAPFIQAEGRARRCASCLAREELGACCEYSAGGVVPQCKDFTMTDQWATGATPLDTEPHTLCPQRSSPPCCNTNGVCGSFMVGRCVPTSPLVTCGADSLVDAGTEDMGSPMDAGTEDAGSQVDAGTEDAGPLVDAGADDDAGQ